MIEEIQALLPLLQQISDGALAAFIAFLASKIIGAAIWPICLYFAIRVVATSWLRMIERRSTVGEFDFYRLAHKGQPTGISVFGETEELIGLLTDIANDPKYISTRDLTDARAKLAAANHIPKR